MERTPTYAFTLNILTPELSASQTEILADEMLDADLLINRRPIVATKEDKITLTFVEGTHDVQTHLREILFLARVSIRDAGGESSVITEVFATPTNDLVGTLTAHTSVVLDEPLLERIELTDKLFEEEIGN